MDVSVVPSPRSTKVGREADTISVSVLVAKAAHSRGTSGEDWGDQFLFFTYFARGAPLLGCSAAASVPMDTVKSLDIVHRCVGHTVFVGALSFDHFFDR